MERRQTTRSRGAEQGGGRRDLISVGRLGDGGGATGGKGWRRRRGHSPWCLGFGVSGSPRWGEWEMGGCILFLGTSVRRGWSGGPEVQVLNETLTSVYIHGIGVGATCQCIGAGLAGLRTRASLFHACEKLSAGSRVAPAPVPVGTYLDPYPRLTGLISAGTRIFPSRCHLYPQLHPQHLHLHPQPHAVLLHVVAALQQVHVLWVVLVQLD
jgi:hypothetical protein